MTSELLARVRGPVIALDRNRGALRDVDARALRVVADAEALPLPDACVDLVVTQLAWLWLGDPACVAREVRRVLAPGGVLVSVAEPDFDGAIEHPPETALAPTWEAVLRRLGADPRGGRKLPGWLRAAGFSRVESEIRAQLASPDELAALRRDEGEALLALGLDSGERRRVEAALASRSAFAFVPFVSVVAE